MVTIKISDNLDLALEDAAQRTGRSKEELAEDILAAHLEQEREVDVFSGVHLERLRNGLEQLQRGEKFDSEHVARKFENWRKERATR
jgi:predicted transcriptional regulator